ncbi:DUF917 domain-containing protein [Histidinibacterium lentulum]|uniref:DUF917 domain-containing protein n=1 Tax=Histidinibacterium lentulum TaxID=2480588 RepID=A0A3N2R9U2_9RHOB|nr:DUF917 domain-containing protein [Histidinibacterium lentulum]ROU04177.1 DUF917 domain-containing protein [Histidinibacterium lentulum]
MRPITEITRADMAHIALGGAFLGTGGGGDPYIGKLMAEQAIAEHGPVPVLDVEALDDDALVVPVAMMGAPTVMLEKLPRGDEAINALRSLEAVLGRKADAIFCIEAGGLNSTIPIAVAASAGLPIVDGDGMGRAFPELQMVSMTMFGIHACPMAMADEKGNALVLNTVDNLSTEKFARVITVEMGGAGLIALYPMTGRQAKEAILRGSLSLIHNIGRIITTEQAANRNPADLLARELNGVRLFEGRVTDVDRRTEGGFARGQARLEGLEAYAGRVLTLKFQNEFLVAEDETGRPLAMTPDLICLLDLETGQPITTEQMGYGFRVIAFGLPCDPKWRSPHGLDLVGPGYFGYAHQYQPIEDIERN